MAMAVSDILQRLGQLKAIRSPYEPLWKDITDYVLPRRSFWDIDPVEGQRPSATRYDSSALIELEMLVDGTLGSLVAINLRWLHLTMQDRTQNDVPWVRDWLEEVEEVLYAEFERSNFYDAFGEFFHDAVSIGTAYMLVEDDPVEDKIIFTTRHPKESFIAEGRGGSVDTLYREFRISNRQMMQTWGEKLDRRRRELYQKRPFAKGTMVHAVYPRAERNPSRIDRYNKAWASVYIDKEFHNEEILDEGGFDEFPGVVWRWRKNSDETYGRSPAGDAIGEVLLKNQMAHTTLRVAQLTAEPPLMVPSSMKGQERIVPKGYNYYTDPKQVIAPIQMGQHYQVTKDQEREVRESIRAHFRTKMFLLMEQLEGTNHTATEINARQGERATLQSPTIGRLNSEALMPLVQRVYRICERNGKIPPPPPGLEGGRIRIEFQGPLAQQTKKFHQTQGVEAAVGYIQAVGQMFPESLDNVDGDELMRIGLDAKSSPQRVIRELPQVEELRKMRMAEQQRQEQEAAAMQQTELLAGNANKLNEPIKPDSMLATLAAATKQQAPGAGTGGRR